MSAIDDLQEQIDDINDGFSDFQDDTSQNFSDIQDYQNDNDQNVSDLQGSEGQLAFPLTQDTIDLINQQFPRGQITLSGGTATLLDARIAPTSTIIYSVGSASGVGSTSFSAFPVTVKPLQYSVAVSAGQAVFASSYSTDSSTINYLLLA